MRRAVLVTGHYVRSRRRAGFHFLADALRRAGWHVTFFTAALSQLSRLKRDHRFQYGVGRRAGRPEEVDDRLTSFVWLTPWHPLNRMPTLANVLLDPLLRHYGSFPLGQAEPFVRAADLFVFESTAGVMLFDRFRAMNPRARYVYRMSDDLRLLRAHPRVVAAEAAMAPHLDLISIPTESIYRRFRHFPNAVLHHHGIDKGAFTRPTPNPYGERASVNAVFVGSTHFDTSFLDVAADACPEWAFHVIGPIARLPSRANVVRYGEIPFAETIPYLAHADVGLNTLRHTGWTESLGDSLKVIQYTYLRLPVVMPDFMQSRRDNTFTYTPGDVGSIREALSAARSFDRSSVSVDGIWSWDELAARITGDVRP